MHSAAELDQRDRRILASYWWQRAEGERTSWAAFRQVRKDLEELKTPTGILELADRAVLDEYQHSLFCADWARRFGHPERELKPRTTDPLRFRGASTAIQPLLRCTLCCLTETTGCFVLLGARSVIVDPELRALSRRHLADELQHGRVGWSFLASRGAEERKIIAEHLPLLLQALEEANDLRSEESWDHLVPWGYFSAGLVRQATECALREAILPGLLELGIG